MGAEKRLAISMLDNVFSILINHYGNKIKVVEKLIHIIKLHAKVTLTHGANLAGCTFFPAWPS